MLFSAGLDNPSLYRTFTAGAGLEVRQYFDCGKQLFDYTFFFSAYMKPKSFHSRMRETNTEKRKCHRLKQHRQTVVMHRAKCVCISSIFNKAQKVPGFDKSSVATTAVWLQVCTSNLWLNMSCTASKLIPVFYCVLCCFASQILPLQTWISLNSRCCVTVCAGTYRTFHSPSFPRQYMLRWSSQLKVRTK